MTEEKKSTPEKETKPHTRKPYQKPTITSEPLFESCASDMGKVSLIDPLCFTDLAS